MEEDNRENDDKIINGKRTSYKASEVAAILDIPASTLRYMVNKLEPLIDPIEKTAGGHRLYHENNIKQLKAILEIMHKEHYTVENMVEYLSEPDGSKEIRSLTPENDLLTAVAAVVERRLEQFQEQKIEAAADFIAMRFKEELQKSNREMSEKISAELQEVSNIKAKEHKEEVDELNKKIEELTKTVNDLQEKLMEKGKKKFLFFGK